MEEVKVNIFNPEVVEEMAYGANIRCPVTECAGDGSKDPKDWVCGACIRKHGMGVVGSIKREVNDCKRALSDISRDIFWDIVRAATLVFEEIGLEISDDTIAKKIIEEMGFSSLASDNVKKAIGIARNNILAKDFLAEYFPSPQKLFLHQILESLDFKSLRIPESAIKPLVRSENDRRWREDEGVQKGLYAHVADQVRSHRDEWQKKKTGPTLKEAAKEIGSFQGWDVTETMVRIALNNLDREVLREKEKSQSNHVGDIIRRVKPIVSGQAPGAGADARSGLGAFKKATKVAKQ